RLRGFSNLDGDSIRNCGKRVFIGAVVANINGESIGHTHTLADPADGSAFIPVDAGTNLIHLIATAQNKRVAGIFEGRMNNVPKFVGSFWRHQTAMDAESQP